MARHLLFAGLLVLLAGSARAQQPDVTSVEFFGMLRQPDGSAKYYQANIVPLLPGVACYGWRAKVGDVPGNVPIREVLLLPAAPASWTGVETVQGQTTYSADGRTAVTEIAIPQRNGWVGNTWCIGEGDPLGNYALEIHIYGKFVKRLDFQVKKLRVK